MAKIGRQSASVKVGRMPTWINDTADQAQWEARFIGILKRDYGNSDSTISAILRNEELVRICAVKIRSYVDKEATSWLYKQRKARGAEYKRQFEIAIAGMYAAIVLYTDQGNQAAAMYLRTLGIELLGQLEHCEAAFATKRHGRDRAHSTLSECHLFLEAVLGQAVTFVTLANLVNAGCEADWNIPKEPITEEHIRKNLSAFKRNNPLWHNEIDAYLKLPPLHPATK
jgi:hypothetical protein